MDAFDPAETLQDGDPLRAWAAQHLDGGDPSFGLSMITDPRQAIEKLIARGVPPPPSTDLSSDALGYNVAGARPSPYNADDKGNVNPIIRVNPDGTIAGNITSPTDPDAKPSVPFTPPAADTPFDPEPEFPQGGVPMPQARPKEADAPTDISAEAKTTDKQKANAFDGLTKTLAALKPVQPPAPAPVGTPSVRGTSAPQTANIVQLLAQMGQSVKPSPVETLGRLLVAGKA